MCRIRLDLLFQAVQRHMQRIFFHKIPAIIPDLFEKHAFCYYFFLISRKYFQNPVLFRCQRYRLSLDPRFFPVIVQAELLIIKHLIQLTACSSKHRLDMF